ncbi:MAG: hypothetical protein NTY48_07025 [Candidatus Diapherotrites archaeon]|nr:hypothetical protein [Candidatus Diapherotrites archaeon]
MGLQINGFFAESNNSFSGSVPSQVPASDSASIASAPAPDSIGVSQVQVSDSVSINPMPVPDSTSANLAPASDSISAVPVQGKKSMPQVTDSKPKNGVNKKIVAICAIVVVIIIIFAALFFSGSLAGVISNQGNIFPGSDNNSANPQKSVSSSEANPAANMNASLDANVSPDANYCEGMNRLPLGKKIGILSEDSNGMSSVSKKGEKAAFVLVYENGVLKETILNNLTISPTPNTLVDLLKSKGITVLVLDSPRDSLIQALKSNDINCYKAKGRINSLIGHGP